ncbi:hypothetical protein A2U01_0091824, partial [Trifolium medium]|nr:hypothetical protein [Trifolium medium]
MIELFDEYVALWSPSKEPMMGCTIGGALMSLWESVTQ